MTVRNLLLIRETKQIQICAENNFTRETLKEMSYFVICFAVFHAEFLWRFGLFYVWAMTTGEA